MIDTFALIVSHGLLVIVVLRLMKVPDPSVPPKRIPLQRPALRRPERAPRA